MDFSLETYGMLLNALLAKFPAGDYRVAPTLNHPQRCIVRHDVDRWPHNALMMASIERDRGVTTSYYFRSREIRTRSKLIQRIARDGHEVGYHYEVLARTHGDFDKARGLFEDDLTRLRAIASVNSVAMHGSPLSKYNSIEFWSRFSLEDFDLAAEAFHLVDHSEWTYLTDTGRSWSERSANLRDHAANAHALPDSRSTADLISHLEEVHGNLCLVVHPERWNRAGVRFAIAGTRDVMFNMAKHVLLWIRGENERKMHD
jgi:hypothetical protein